MNVMNEYEAIRLRGILASKLVRIEFQNGLVDDFSKPWAYLGHTIRQEYIVLANYIELAQR